MLYVCVCVYIYIYIYIHTHIYIQTNKHIHINDLCCFFGSPGATIRPRHPPERVIRAAHLQQML